MRSPTSKQDDPKARSSSRSDRQREGNAWGKQAPRNLSVILKPILVANGDHDIMVPSSNSIDLARRLPNAELVLYEDAGHGGIFQYHETFVKKALALLEA